MVRSVGVHHAQSLQVSRVEVLSCEAVFQRDGHALMRERVAH